MVRKIFIDRSRVQIREKCPRRRWLEYHEAGTGIVPSKTPLPLAVGGAVHEGLAVLLKAGQMAIDNPTDIPGAWLVSWTSIEEDAVRTALADFAHHASGLELDATEISAMQLTPEAQRQNEELVSQAKDLGMSVEGIGVDRQQSKSQFEKYLYAEQSALVEALIRAYSRRRLRSLLEQFEVLEVEREGEWKLSEWQEYGHEWQEYGHHIWTHEGVDSTCIQCGVSLMDNKTGPNCNPSYELWFMSRPDALLRERSSNELYLLSFKTTGAWDIRKARDIEHDMQGLSEGVEVERRLSRWWEWIHSRSGLTPYECIAAEGGSSTMAQYLYDLAAPPRIHAIRYEFLLKGTRLVDKDMTARLGMEVRTQRSPLIRQYVAVSTPKKGDGGYQTGDICWSWDFYRPEDDKTSTLAWQNWKGRAVWENALVREWIDQLSAAELLMSGEDSTIGLEPRALGWKSPAQAMGATKEHPLDSVFVPPVVVYRNIDDLRDWIDSLEAQETQAAKAVAEINATRDVGERRHLLNIHFPMVRTACEFPSQCPFARDRISVCYGTAEMKADPIAQSGGEYVHRKYNHPQEAQALVQIK